MDIKKQSVHDFWQQAACGEELYLDGRDQDAYRRQATTRYRLEPFIIEFAEFQRFQNKKVLEIGVGLGADHQRFAEARAVVSGIDLTSRAVELR